MRKLKQSLGADAGFPGEPLAIDAERGAVQQLVGVLDATRSQAPDVVVRDPAEVLERPVHRYRICGHAPQTMVAARIQL